MPPKVIANLKLIVAGLMIIGLVTWSCPAYCSSVSCQTEDRELQNSSSRDDSFTIITREEIRASGVHDIVELLNEVAGVKATETSISLRGAPSKQVLVLLDGRPLNDPLTGSVNLGMISVHNIEKIEICKGSGSVVYGGDTIGGIIRITTRKITKRPGGKMELSYGRFDTQKYDLNYTQEIGSLGYSITGSWNKTHGHRKNGDQDKKAGALKLSYQVTEESSLSCTANYSKKESGSPGRIDYPTPVARSEKEDWGATLGYRIKQWEINTYASGFDKRNENPAISLDYTMKSHVLGGDIKRNIDIPYLGALILGTGGKRSKVDAAKVGKHEEDELSVFGEKEVRFEDIPLSLGLGIRGRRHSEYDWALNPQVSLTYKLPKADIKLSVNKAATIPTFYERYCKSTFREGNPGLSEEKAINYNAALGYKFNEFLEGTLAFFFADIGDLITSVEGEDRVWRYVNVGSASRKGIELEAKMSLFDHLTINGAYTYLIAKNDDTGKYIIYRPKHKVNIRLKYTLCDKLIFYLTDEYVSKRFADQENTETMSEYNLLDFEINYPFWKAILFGKIDNLLGEEYEVHRKYPMPKTTYTMGVTYEF